VRHKGLLGLATFTQPLLQGSLAYYRDLSICHAQMHVRAVLRHPFEQEPASNGTAHAGAHGGLPQPGAYITTFWCTYATSSGAKVAAVLPCEQTEYKDWEYARAHLPRRAPATAWPCTDWLMAQRPYAATDH